jgi:SAM-dependent methyltransferase
MVHIDLLQPLHKATNRDYLARVLAGNKADLATLAKKFDVEYWDAGRETGYGGYRYDGRWFPVAQSLCDYYGLKSGDKILDVGCGKGFLLYELTRALSGLEVHGVDISPYALKHAKDEVKGAVQLADASALPFLDGTFDLVISLNTLHNLCLPDVYRGLREIERVGRRRKYIVMDSYRNEQEKVNLLYWQLTCECFFNPKEWEFIFQEVGYTGDYGFIYFE